MQHTATLRNTVQHPTTYAIAQSTPEPTMQHTATLAHPATSCNTLQNPASYLLSQSTPDSGRKSGENSRDVSSRVVLTVHFVLIKIFEWYILY